MRPYPLPQLIQFLHILKFEAWMAGGGRFIGNSRVGGDVDLLAFWGDVKPCSQSVGFLFHSSMKVDGFEMRGSVARKGFEVKSGGLRRGQEGVKEAGRKGKRTYHAKVSFCSTGTATLVKPSVLP